MPSCLAGWKASGRRRWLNWPNGFIFPLDDVNGSMLRLEVAAKSSADNSDLTQHSALSTQHCRAPERPNGVTAGYWRAFIV